MRHSKKPANDKRAKQANHHSAATGMVRIISGQWRGRKLPVLTGDGLRPTTDRTKETLFNWLMTDITGLRCLDAFAGSGSLGFEALSRGAKHVTFIEKNKAAAQQLNKNLQLLKVALQSAEVMQGDALMKIAQCDDKPFDLIFLDPPFQQSLVEPALSQIVQHNLLQPGGLLYLEMEEPEPTAIDPAYWNTIKLKTTGQFSYRLLQRLS